MYESACFYIASPTKCLLLLFSPLCWIRTVSQCNLIFINLYFIKSYYDWDWTFFHILEGHFIYIFVICLFISCQYFNQSSVPPFLIFISCLHIRNISFYLLYILQIFSTGWLVPFWLRLLGLLPCNFCFVYSNLSER